MTAKGSRPVLALTMGDPAGIGPEIVLKALASPEVAAACRPVVVGDAGLLDRLRAAVAPSLRLLPARAPSAADPGPAVEVIQPRPLSWKEPVVGRVDAEAGRASLAYIEKAVSLAMAGAVDAMVTAPISKEAVHLAGSAFPGHTEMLAHLTGARDYAMMLVGGKLRVSLATIHIPLRLVPLDLREDRLLTVIRLTARALADMGLPGSRVAVCGLNPHAGEGGLFGDEEKRIIRPAILRAEAEGLLVAGPLPADTVFHRALKGEFEGVVAMYHDQGLGPLKTLYFDQGVNVTLGLPIVRTSVDHGTAFDIAGRGEANPGSMVAAIRLAAVMAANRPARPSRGRTAGGSAP